MAELVDAHDLSADRQAQNQMSYYVYVIKSIKKRYRYIGLTDNLERRILQHNKGYNKTTRPYAPFQVLLIEEYSDRQTAREREKYLKSGCGRELLDNISIN